jgi:hypothetical protein
MTAPALHPARPVDSAGRAYTLQAVGVCDRCKTVQTEPLDERECFCGGRLIGDQRWMPVEDE